MNRTLRHIMCVDDERDILDVVRMCLEVVGGFEVTTCESGQAALDVLAGGLMPDLILLDVMMPGMNGPETLAGIRRRPELSEVPVIFVTARVQESEVRAYLRLGVTAVIPKPFDPMKLSGEVAMVWNAFNEVRAATASADDDVEARMAELRSRYVESLDGHVARLVAWRRQLENGDLSVAERAEFRTVAHRLAGTGKTYGFADISEVARLIDDRLITNPGMPAADLSVLGGLLIAACRTAQTGGAGAATTPRPAAEPARKTFGRKAGPAPQAAVAMDEKPTVLVADDDRMVRALFVELLGDAARLIEAADTDEALRLMRLHRPDLVLLDDIMPGGITGLKLLETLQASGEFAGTPILMITASDSEADIRRGLAAGAAEYITKPFDGARVVAGIRARLDRLALKVG